MFNDIVMINYSRPLAERAKSRKSVGPYRWRPTAAPSKGRGFYQASNSLAMDSRGSTFALRLISANDGLPSYSRLAQINGYYFNDDGETIEPIIARLPKGRGFLVGWTMGRGMCASLEATIYDDIGDAALAAHSDAEYAAEQQREYEAREADDY